MGCCGLLHPMKFKHIKVRILVPEWERIRETILKARAIQGIYVSDNQVAHLAFQEAVTALHKKGTK